MSVRENTMRELVRILNQLAAVLTKPGEVNAVREAVLLLTAQFDNEGQEKMIKSLLSVVYPDIREAAEKDLRSLIAAAVHRGLTEAPPSIDERRYQYLRMAPQGNYFRMIPEGNGVWRVELYDTTALDAAIDVGLQKEEKERNSKNGSIDIR